jgi:hydroxymethylpyrimidine/phosphomethylpyrimidine kinase
MGVQEILGIPSEFVARQIHSVLSDIGADAIKTGMLGEVDIIKAVADSLDALAEEASLVVDPVMVASDGTRLLKDDAVELLRKDLIPLADVVTPNIPEAEVLIERKIISVEDMKSAGAAILAFGCTAVLVKGGHLEGDELHDVLMTHDMVEVMSAPRIKSTNTHGTGCTLAAALAVALGGGMALRDAVQLARDFVREAMLHAEPIGNGTGPLNHQFQMIDPRDD